MSPPVVLLHGFAGHAESWRAVRERLPGRRVEALTLYGHDHEAPPTSAIAFEDEVARIAGAIRAIGEPVRLCGYSMGGRIALGVLALAPELVGSAILVGVHPGLTSEDERGERAAADEVWARLLEEEGTAAFVAKWQALPLFATQERLDAATLARQRTLRLRHPSRSLALAMRSLGLARMPSYWDALPSIRAPLDLVVGALDTKFVALAARMAKRLSPGVGRVLHVRGAGHNVVLEAPELLADLIASEATSPPPTGIDLVTDEGAHLGPMSGDCAVGSIGPKNRTVQ